MRQLRPACWLAAIVLFVLYFHGLSASGLLGPDEPRYASIGRQMAQSGDWVTPRLWGAPWFEKPALLYWMIAAGFRAGLGPELAPRLPVALLSVAFLIWYLLLLRKEFGKRAAAFAAAILATSAGWLGYSQVAVTDLPLSAAFGAAMVLSLAWVARGETTRLPLVAACLGVAVLAKGLVPLVLALPLLWAGRARWRHLLAWRVAGAFLLVALPWYTACYLANGRAFIDTFFLEHHFGRFASGALMHRQPWWFYLPVFAAGLLPWTPLLVPLMRRTFYVDPRRRFLGLVVLFGLVFFSVSTNKLPGYLLPLLPAAAALMGVALDEMRDARAWLSGCALGTVFILVAGEVLPGALESGLSRTAGPRVGWTWLIPVALAAAAWWLEASKRRAAAMALVVAVFSAGVVHLKRSTLPALDRDVSARPLWRAIEPRAAAVCVMEIHRAMRYGLNYYTGVPLPDCRITPRPLCLVQAPGAEPALEPCGGETP